MEHRLLDHRLLLLLMLQDFTAAIERIVAGLEKRNRVLNPKARETVAFHKMGHALVSLALPGTDPVHKISIIPCDMITRFGMGEGLGYMAYEAQWP